MIFFSTPLIPFVFADVTHIRVYEAFFFSFSPKIPFALRNWFFLLPCLKLIQWPDISVNHFSFDWCGFHDIFVAIHWLFLFPFFDFRFSSLSCDFLWVGWCTAIVQTYAQSVLIAYSSDLRPKIFTLFIVWNLCAGERSRKYKTFDLFEWERVAGEERVWVWKCSYIYVYFSIVCVWYVWVSFLMIWL